MRMYNLLRCRGVVRKSQTGQEAQEGRGVVGVGQLARVGKAEDGRGRVEAVEARLDWKAVVLLFWLLAHVRGRIEDQALRLAVGLLKPTLVQVGGRVRGAGLRQIIHLGARPLHQGRAVVGDPIFDP